MESQKLVDVRLKELFGTRVRDGASLVPFNTFRTGGPADWLLQTDRPDELVTAIRETAVLGIPLTILGGGSNVLVGDGGV